MFSLKIENVLTISDFSYHIAILMIIKNNDKTTKLALIVLLLVVFFDSGASKGSHYLPISVMA